MAKPHIVIEGPDGTGKSTILQTIVAYLQLRGAGELVDVCAHERATKTPFDLAGAHLHLDSSPIIAVCEPTWSGSTEIRRLLDLPEGHPESLGNDPEREALLYAEDRAALFSPDGPAAFARKWGLCLVQSRGVLSTLLYQVDRCAQKRNRSRKEALDWILSLNGNLLELKHPPDLLLILTTNPNIAHARVGEREHPRDGFEKNTELQRQLGALYADPLFLNVYREIGTRHIEFLDTSGTKEATAALCNALLSRVFAPRIETARPLI